MASPHRIRFLGTGTAFHTDGRGCQAILFRPAGRGGVLLDVGPDTMRAFAAQQADPSTVDTVFITHLHGDHTAGWPFLLLQWIYVDRRESPLQVIGPAGIREHLEALARLAYGDLVQEQAFEIGYTELGWGEERRGTTAAGLSFLAVPVDHHPSSLGFRIEASGLTFSVSGDTSWCAGLERVTSGCDVAIVECTYLTPGPGAHLSLEEIRRHRGQLGDGRLVLVHLPDAVAKELATDPLARTVAAHDGWVLEL